MTRTLRSSFCFAACLLMCIGLSACSQSAVTVLNDITLGIEAIAPTLIEGGVIPQKYEAPAAWTVAAAAVVSQCATTAASGVTTGQLASDCYTAAQTAANQFLSLSPDDQNKAAAIEKSIQLILAMFAAPPIQGPANPPNLAAQMKRPMTMRPADIPKLGQLRTRAQAVQTRVQAKLSPTLVIVPAHSR